MNQNPRRPHSGSDTVTPLDASQFARSQVKILGRPSEPTSGYATSVSHTSAKMTGRTISALAASPRTMMPAAVMTSSAPWRMR